MAPTRGIPPSRRGGLHDATPSLLFDGRRRRHLAFVSSLLAVTALIYVVLTPRSVRVQADGRDIALDTYIGNDRAVVGRAGIDVHPGDRLTALDGGTTDVIRVERSREVVLRADGMTYRMHTHAATIDQLLAEADVAVTARDSVFENDALVSTGAALDPPQVIAATGDAPQLIGTIAIDVRRAVRFAIVENGREVSSTSSRPTVAQALHEAGVIVGPGDALSLDAQAPLEADTRIEVRHAQAVTVALPEGHQVLYTLSATVGEALTEAGISVPEGAFVEPSLDAPVTPGMSVRVVQLSGSSDTEREFIESHTVFALDASLTPGEVRTVKGHDGARLRQYAVSYVDGEEVGRELLDERFDPEPVDTVIYYPARTGENDAKPADSGGVRKTVRVYATWYDPASSGRSPDDASYGHTANGGVVTYGVVAVDPDVIPLGTRMFIPGYGYAVAADTGGAVKGYTIDLGYPDGVKVDWQTKWVDIYILS